jgi:hypothetical protein
MRIKRIELIEQLKQRIIQLEAAVAEDNKGATEKVKASEAEYITRTAPAWQEYAARIMQRVHGGQAVLDSDKPATLQREGAFRLSKPVYKRAATGELKQLIKLLEASPDETVSLASLERAGFSLGRVLK